MNQIEINMENNINMQVECMLNNDRNIICREMFWANAPKFLNLKSKSSEIEQPSENIFVNDNEKQCTDFKDKTIYATYINVTENELIQVLTQKRMITFTLLSVNTGKD